MGGTSATADFEDLEIKISMKRVSLRLAGTDYAGIPRFDEGTFAELDRQRAEGDAQEYGNVLLDALFDGDMKATFEILRDRIGSRRDRFRVRLNIDPDAAELHSLWWEALHHPKTPATCFGIATRTPLSRWVGGDPQPPAKGEKLRILVVVASPSELDGDKWPTLHSLNEEQETEPLRDALKELEDVDWCIHDGRATVQDIRLRLLEERFHVLHLICHGTFDARRGEGAVLLEDAYDEKAADVVGENTMRDLVDGVDELKLVVLASCHGADTDGTKAFKGLGPKMAQSVVPAVVALQDRVTESTARTFTKAFYRTLTSEGDQGGYVDIAANRARDLLRFAKDAWAWAAPVVFLRGGGKVFERTQPDVDVVPARGAIAPGEAVASVTPISRIEPAARGPLAGPTDERLELIKLLIVTHRFDEEDLDYLSAALSIGLYSARTDTRARAWELVDRCFEQGRLVELRQWLPNAVAQRDKRRRGGELGHSFPQAS